MRRLGNRLQVADEPKHIRALHHHARGFVIDMLREIFRAAGFRMRANHLARERRERLDRRGIMRMQAARKHGFGPARDALRHQHGLSRRGRAVVERGVRHFHAGHERHLRLEFEQILQRTLRDLRLIRRIRGEKFRALDQVIHRCGDMMPVGAGAAEERDRSCRDVLSRYSRQRALDLEFALRVGKRRERFAADHRFLRHVAEQSIDVRHVNGAQHGAAVVRCKRKIAHGQSDFVNSAYWASVISLPVSPLFDTRSLKNQPSPSGSALIFEGSSPSAGLVSLTSPLTGA